MEKMTFATDRSTKEELALLGNSSGLILNEDNNTVSLGYVDYDVSEFGGRDYECFYELDSENAALLRAALQKAFEGDLFDMCVQAFSIKFSNLRFEAFCSENGISYFKKTY